MSIRRRLAAIELEIRKRRRGPDLDCLSAGQRERYQQWITSQRAFDYEQLINGEAPQLDRDIQIALYGYDLDISPDDDDETASDKYRRFLDR